MIPGKNHIRRVNATPDHAGSGVFRRDHLATGLRKCTPRAEERVTKAELETVLRAVELDGHRQASFAAHIAGVAPSTFHGWRNPQALDRLPTRRAIDLIENWGRARLETERFLRVVGAK